MDKPALFTAVRAVSVHKSVGYSRSGRINYIIQP